MNKELTIGVVGAGGFARFAALAFQKVQGIRIAGVTDINLVTADQFSEELKTKLFTDYNTLLADPDIDLVYIATPPYLHYEQSKKALKSGKHVICEKPAALKTHEAEELSAYAHRHQLLYTVNLMQRYNPLYGAVSKIISEKWLGDFVHGYFENYASDEKLIPEHWFWDEEQSGGIFIEHGVHFFDMFSGWLGKGELIHSMEIERPNVSRRIVDRVQAIVSYDNNPVNFYHGFNQPKILDRQELRLQFDHGDITLYEWVPVRIRLHGLLKNEILDDLQTLFPGGTIYHHSVSGHPLQAKGKFRDISFDTLITMEAGDSADKMQMYEQLVISMIKDQWTWIMDHGHKRIIDHTNAIESLRIAENATIMARRQPLHKDA